MRKLFRQAAKLGQDVAGQAMVEYVLLLMLVSFALVAGIRNYATSVSDASTSVGAKIGIYIAGANSGGSGGNNGGNSGGGNNGNQGGNGNGNGGDGNNTGNGNQNK